MNFKRKTLTSAVAGAIAGVGLMAGAPAVMAQTINGTPCEAGPNNGLGLPTCAHPDATLAEKVLWAGAEQAVSLIAGLADGFGCLAKAGTFPISVVVDQTATAAAPQGNPGALGGFIGRFSIKNNVGNPNGYSYKAEVKVDDASNKILPTPFNVVTQIVTSDIAAGPIGGEQHQDLAGQFTSDSKFAIVFGNADWRAGAAELDEHLIKDFYTGIPVIPTWKDNTGAVAPTGICPLNAAGFPTEADYLAGNCVVDNIGDHNPLDPLELVRVVRDNGLEVTTKKTITDNLLPNGNPVGDPPLVEIGAPKGKWRQTSFYREPNGPGFGALQYTKVRIAPFGAPVCALQLNMNLAGNTTFFQGSGTISLVNMAAP